MSMTNPTLEEWRDLYLKAADFREHKFWEGMYDSDIFAVQNPQTGEIGYCCIMGNLGEVFALQVYLGTDGLASYQKICDLSLSGKRQKEDTDKVMLTLRMLEVAFEDGSSLHKKELQIIKELGLKFRGAQGWTCFRGYSPGYWPWFITREEGHYLSLVLTQAIDVCLRFKKDEMLLSPPQEGKFLVRVPQKQGEEIIWKDAWREPAPFEKETHIISLDEVYIQRIKDKCRLSGGIWELDVVYLPEPVEDKEGERPYFTQCIFIVEQGSGLVIPFSELIKPSKYPPSVYMENFLQTVEKFGVLPRAIYFNKEEHVIWLKPVTSSLGVGLRRVKRLKALEDARTEFNRLMSFRLL